MTTWLADTNYFGDTESGGLAGPLGLLFIVLLAIATVLLIRNMNSRLRRLPDHFPGQEPADGADAPAGGATGTAAVDAPVDSGPGGRSAP
jgi:hypothetical protein